jgi:hypothetical protein
MLTLLLLVDLRILLSFLDMLLHAQLAELLPQILYKLFLPLILLSQPGLFRFVLFHLYLDIFVHSFKVVELAESLLILHQLLAHLSLLPHHATVLTLEPSDVLFTLYFFPIELLQLDLEAPVIGLVVHELFLKL